MPLIAAVNLRHTFGQDIILDGCSLSIEPGERIGLVGRNGTGKSTLMKCLGGLIAPDSGTITVQRGARVGYLQQDPDLDPGETLRDAAEGAFEQLHRLHAEQHGLFDAMAEATARGDSAGVDRLLKQQAEVERQIETAGGYAIDHKIDAVLHGLGFTDAQFTIKVKDLSGGQKGRLALARLLLEEPEVLLLDEPTNHLDIDGRLWLEQFLTQEYRGAVLMVSHDRYLLDAVVNRIIETEQGRLIDYPGNYEAFRELRAERLMVMHRAYESQQTKFKKEEEFIRRYKAGQRAKQARGRQTKLEREKLDNTLERPMELAALRLELPKAERTGDIVVAARGLSKKYPNEDGTEKVLFSNLDVVIGRGERWGIIGPNGAGKTTLVRCLLKDLEPDTGTVKIGSNVKIGYYRQTHEGVDPDLPVYRYLQGVILKECPGQALSEQAARNLAGAFLFSGDEQQKEMGVLSGGERSRAVLAGLLASAKNVLVLDEPTNHLDIPSAERLEEALSVEGGFEGTLILISHDRALIDATCDHVLVLDGKGGARIVLGNYTDWHEKDVAERREAQERESESRRRREEAERAQRAAEEARKKQAAAKTGPSVNALSRMKTEQLEAKIEQIETRIKAIDAAFADPDVWRDADKASALGQERQKLVADLEPLEFEWSQRAG
ncbi:MAG: ABC-F family ATP-binding cassette domain-containing protein [Phycisphaeraceae bacterium]|nr:ABC-F family ATP-binding cassette domain-containing protein [Phycisphaeraceae bacterium]